MILFETGKGSSIVKIKVFGVGGAGGNILDTMIRQKVKGVSFAAVNTDIQDLNLCEAEEKIQIGKELTNGLGAGANPVRGAKAAEESIDILREAIEDYDVCIFVAGMGGGTGTGATPEIARMARELGKMVVAFVTTPFTYEGKNKISIANHGLDKLKEHASLMASISNNTLYDMISEDAKYKSSFQKVDNVIMNAVKAISGLILEPGDMNLDFADVQTIMSIKGESLIAFGSSTGMKRATNAVDAALSNVIVGKKKISGAKGVLLNIIGGEDLNPYQIQACMEKVSDKVHEDANIILGIKIDNSMNEKVMVTIIATGIEDRYQSVIDCKPRAVERTTTLDYDRVSLSNNFNGEGSAYFDIKNEDFEEILDIPTYIRNQRNFTGH